MQFEFQSLKTDLECAFPQRTLEQLPLGLGFRHYYVELNLKSFSSFTELMTALTWQRRAGGVG